MKNSNIFSLLAFLSCFVCFIALPLNSNAESTGNGEVIEKNIPFAQHYKGGQDSLLADIQKILVYPANARKQRIQGTVIVDFDLNEDGSINSITVLKKIGGGCDGEAIRIIKELQNTGKIIAPGYKQKYSVPVKFKI